MGTQAHALIPDQNFNDPFKGTSVGEKLTASRAQKKVGLGGRKALTDVTNSGKPSLHHSKKSNASGGSVNVSKPLSSVGGKNNVSNAQKKVAGGRKALSDVTNSGKHCPYQPPKKNNSNKLNAIAEEQCLHNHQECINSQRRAMDMDFFLRTFDDDFSLQMESPGVLSMLKESKAESPPRYLELEEIPELLNECRSPPQCWTPESPNTSPIRNGYQSPNLVLKGTPDKT